MPFTAITIAIRCTYIRYIATAKPAIGYRLAAAFPYSRGDRKCSLLIGRDLKCVAFALTTTTRACGSRLAHLATSSSHHAAPRRPRTDSKRSHVENSRSPRAHTPDSVELLAWDRATALRSYLLLSIQRL